MSLYDAILTKVQTITGASVFGASSKPFQMSPEPLPQNADLPFITYFEGSDVSHNAIDNSSQPSRTRITLTIYDNSYTLAKKYEEQVIRPGLKQLTNTAVSTSSGTVVSIQSLLHEFSIDDYDLPEDQDARNVRYKRLADFEVVYTEAT